jgi:hypothetical protein
MEYFVADSYIGWELIGTPYEKNNKLYTKARTKCDRCYNGVYITRVENGVPVPHPNYGGVCLKCNGAGYLEKEIRLYTEKEKDAAARSKMRAAERKEAERLASAEKKKEEWLKREGFGLNGTTTIYIGLDSYEKKDELKADGWKYSAIGWHVDPEIAADKYPLDSIITLPWEDLVEFNIYGEGFWLSSAKKYVDDIRDSHRPHTSIWIGEEKERFFDLPVVVSNITGYANAYGWTNVIIFKNGENILTWMTSSPVKCEKGEEYYLTATVKKHTEYKGEKQTVILRAKLTKREE